MTPGNYSVNTRNRNRSASTCSPWKPAFAPTPAKAVPTRTQIVRAILSHADYCNVPRQSALEHTLFACDEIAGFLTACAYVRPSKSILDLEGDSVKRRMKDKLFAKGVSREDVRKGAEELGIPLEEHIAFCIAAMREHVDALGLRGSL